MQFHPLFSDEFLFANWSHEFEQFVESTDASVLESLKQWNDRDSSQTETQLEGQFVQKFFQNLWGFVATGSQESESEYSLTPQYPVGGAGQRGGTGKADLALGLFRRTDIPDVPQVLCEFKDIKSSLDAPQARKGNTRSPVKQCLDYLKHSFDQTPVNSTLFPAWGVATDMNEFRLYYRKVGPDQYLRFVIDDSSHRLNGATPLIGETEAAQRTRFLFWKVFQQNMLLAPYGRSEMEKLFESQIVQEKALEKGFYLEYKAFRQYIYEMIVDVNPKFTGTKKELVRLTQRFLDRCIFILFCEDMGKTLGFPVNLVQDILIEASTSNFYSSTGNDIWEKIKQLFDAMRDGGVFPPNHTINRFNGGLFETDGQLESLNIPNRVFCSGGQGENRESIAQTKNTLLYLSATYNFGVEGANQLKTITLYALGRIFEQSITELEYMEAEAEAVQQAISENGEEADVAKAIKNAKSIAKINKRKRDGVYYTPEWVTSYIVREVIGARLADERERLELEMGKEFTENQIRVYRENIGKSRAKQNAVTLHLEKLDYYKTFLDNIKVIDPACGSGAFLIQSLQYLISQHEVVASERERLSGSKLLFEQDAVIREVLTNNLYGVDLSPESVEITQLALWLNTARKDKPLSSLGHHIQEGNSLVGPDFLTFYKNKHNSLFGEQDADTQEKINIFDWAEKFPEVCGPNVPFDERGFDCVVGNPPYVKLQNYRKVKPDESDYLLHHTDESGVRVYKATEGGSADLFVPFIEKGISILNPRGRMGFVAPNVWLKSDYGQGLRKQFKISGRLDRWIDFKSHQVFDKVTIYTSLQFFTKWRQDHVKFHLAPDGEVAAIDWDNPVGKAPVAALSQESPWVLLYEKEWRLLNRLNQECQRLDQVCESISVGVQTSADWCYHLDRTDDGKFFQTKPHPDKSPPDGVKYELESEIMKPLVSGEEAKRYLLPDTYTYLLFPYDLSEERPRLWSSKELEEKFPNVWSYLQRYEKHLRERESDKMDVDDGWWAYNYPKNLDKQPLSKLGVAETVPELRLFADKEGDFYFNNVRVNGIILTNVNELFFLLGVMNSPTANWCFTQIAKPKDNGYFEANKQYIAPIPIPNATDTQKSKVAKLAETLQEKHTARRDLIEKLQQRIDSANCREQSLPENWLWADVKKVAEIKEEAPPTITAARDRTAWAKDERKRRLDAQCEKVDSMLRAGMKLYATSDDDALFVKSGDIILLKKYGLEPDEAKLMAALWTQILRTTNVTKKFSADKLVKKLLKFRSTDDAGLRKTMLGLDEKIDSIDAEIERLETKINTLIYKLYDLSPTEIKLVESSLA